MMWLWGVLGLYWLTKQNKPSGPVPNEFSPSTPNTGDVSANAWKNGNMQSPPPVMQLKDTFGANWLSAYARFLVMWNAVDGWGTDEEPLFQAANTLSTAEKVYLGKRRPWWVFDGSVWVDHSSSLAYYIQDDLSGDDLKKMHAIIPTVGG